MTPLVAIACAAPWLALPIITALRARRSRSLAEHAEVPPENAPMVSVVIPARNEQQHIERCVRSALGSHYPKLEVIVVDDHSTDDTGEILARIAREDARLRVAVPDALPAGWFGKQWACAAGAGVSRGDVVAFLDADTEQAPDLVTRSVNAMQSRSADLLTVAGNQELGSFWERLLQPQVFSLMLLRYGGTEVVNESPRPEDKIANGQCIFFRREVYYVMGGHAAVRHKVAEDLALAQLWFSRGRRTVLILGIEQLSTRMYTSLRELVAGWGKNVYAGGMDSAMFGRFGRTVYPLMLVTPPITLLAPPVVLALSLLGTLGTSALVWSALATSFTFVWWMAVYLALRFPLPRALLYALLYPVGALALLWIFVGAIARGRRVRWKDRDYVAA